MISHTVVRNHPVFLSDNILCNCSATSEPQGWHGYNQPILLRFHQFYVYLMCVSVSLSIFVSVGPVSVYREEVKLRGQGLTQGQAARAQLSWASRPDILTPRSWVTFGRKSPFLSAAVLGLGSLTDLCCSCELRPRQTRILGRWCWAAGSSISQMRKLRLRNVNGFA